MGIKIMRIEAEGSSIEEILKIVEKDLLENKEISQEAREEMLKEIRERLEKHNVPTTKEEAKKPNYKEGTLDELLDQILKSGNEDEKEKEEEKEEKIDETFWDTKEGKKIIAGHALGLFRKY